MREIQLTKTRVWDLPTRLFHWLLAVGVVAMFITVKTGAVEWHARIGYAVGALLIFRLAWGFAGGHWSRFRNFAPSLPAAWHYMRGSSTAGIGHSPLGALAVYAMLLALTAQVSTGLFTETKEDFAGPLASLVSNTTVHTLTGYHKRLGQWLLISLVALHLLAIAMYFVRGRNLVAAMWTGDAFGTPGTPTSRDDAGTRSRALALVAVAAVIMWAVVSLGR